MPSTVDVVLVRREMMTMIETKTNDTMQMTKNMMDEASECVSARACTAHAQRRTRKHAAREHEPGPRHSWRALAMARATARVLATLACVSRAPPSTDPFMCARACPCAGAPSHPITRMHISHNLRKP